MTITQTTAPAASTDAAPEWVGPCGCPVCEKWADCYWCSGCTPDSVLVAQESARAQYAEEARVEALPFWQWLDERG